MHAAPSRMRLFACLVGPALGLLLFVRTGSTQPAPGSGRVEYRVERIELVTKRPIVGPARFLTAQSLQSRLGELGADGWSWSATLPLPDDTILVIFQRGGAPASSAAPPATPAGTTAGAASPPAQPGGHPLAGQVAVGGATLMGLLQQAIVPLQVVDVRPVEAYRSGHIFGAVSIPWTELDRRYAELNPQAAVVVVDAADGRGAGAVNFLTNLGFGPVVVLEGGAAGWPGRVHPGDR